MNTKLGYQHLGKPPDNYRAKTGNGKIILIVGDQNDVLQLRDYPKVEIKQARLVTIEQRVSNAVTRNNPIEIPTMVDYICNAIEAADAALAVPGTWWMIPPIMAAPTKYVGELVASCAERLSSKGIRSVGFNWATGTPKVKPFNPNDDEWPLLYPYLARLSKVGKAWFRIGVEEYVTGGMLMDGDYSNVGRTRYVYNNHIVPNGWDIMFRGIEGSFDLPGTWQVKGMNVPFFWDTMHRVDLVYAEMPYFDALALYAVCDPTNNANEARFAIMPGNPVTHAKPVFEPGLLDGGVIYFEDNPPVRDSSVPPIKPPAPPPVVIPPPLVNLLKNPSFEGGYSFAAKDKFGDRKIPDGWFSGWNTKQADPHAEIDADPPHVRDGRVSWRLWADQRFNEWGGQVVPTVPGATYEIKFLAYGHRLDPALPGPTATLGIDPAGGTDFQAATVQKIPAVTKDVWVEPEVTFVASGPQTTVFVEARTGEDGRGDVWIDMVQMVKIKDPVVTSPPPVTPPPVTPPVDTGVGPAVTKADVDGSLYNLRLTPANLGSTNLIRGKLPVGKKVARTGVTQNGYSQIAMALVLAEGTAPEILYGWILTSGLQPVQS